MTDTDVSAPVRDLIRRLEEATETEGKLIKAALYVALSNGWIDENTFQRAMHWVACEAFIDAALTLVPDDEGETCYEVSTTAERPFAEIWAPKQTGTAFASTAPLALCIAALKARARRSKMEG